MYFRISRRAMNYFFVTQVIIRSKIIPLRKQHFTARSVWDSVLNIEVAEFSEELVKFHQTTWCHTSQDSSLHNHSPGHAES